LAGKSAKKQQLGLDQAFFLSSSKSSKIVKSTKTTGLSKGQGGAVNVDTKAAKPKGTSQSAILDDEKKKNAAAKTGKYETNEDVDLEEFIQRPFGRAKVAKKKKEEEVVPDVMRA
jgi:hypothetical protein